MPDAGPVAPSTVASTALAWSGRTADECALVDALRPGLSSLLARIDARVIDRAHHIDPSVLRALAELGMFGLTIPESWGGAGLSLHGTCSLVALVAERDRAVATTLGLHLGLGTRGLVTFGAAPVQERWLPGLALGEKIAAFATTEPGAGSDLAAIASTAMPDGATGTGWILNGSKIYVTNGGFADVITVTAATPGAGGARRGHSLLVLDRNDPGVRVGPEEDKLGLRGSSTTSLYFDNVTLGADRFVGTPGDGMAHLQHVLAWGRTLMAGGCVGTARAATRAAAMYTSSRRQFGRALVAFEVVREQLASMKALEFAMEAIVRTTAEADAQGDRALLASRSTSAKVFCSESAWQVADLSVQLHGGAGFIEEVGVALMLRDSRITRIFEGANDVLCVHLGLLESGGGHPRAALTGLAGDLGAQADTLHARLCDMRARTAERLGVRFVQHQRLVHRLGTLAMLRDVSDAVALRAHAEGTALARSTAALWMSMAFARVRSLEGAPVDRPVIDDIVAPLLEGVA